MAAAFSLLLSVLLAAESPATGDKQSAPAGETATPAADKAKPAAAATPAADNAKPAAAAKPAAEETKPAAQAATPAADEGNAAPEGATPGAGVSPVELLPRIELRQWYGNLPGGSSSHVTSIRVDIQFFHRLLLKYEGTLQTVSTPLGRASGFGDTEITATGLLVAKPTFLAAVLAGVIFDTASQPLLGTGKKQIEFGGGVGGKPFAWWLPYLLVQELISFGGDVARPDINLLLVRAGNIFFGPEYSWLKLDLDTLIDFETDKGRLYGTLEAGRLLIGQIGLFLRFGTHLAGPPDVDYSIEAGVRYLFRLQPGKQ